jgi:hypothetical protein
MMAMLPDDGFAFAGRRIRRHGKMVTVSWWFDEAGDPIFYGGNTVESLRTLAAPRVFKSTKLFCQKEALTATPRVAVAPPAEVKARPPATLPDNFHRAE